MRKYLIVGQLLLLTACVAPQPAPPPAAPAAPAPPPPPPPAPVSQDWRDWPLTPGTWIYRADAGGSSAMFGRAGVEADVIVRCDRASRKLILSLPAASMPAGGSVTITTSNGSATYPGSAAVGVNGRIGISFPINDPFLDRLAFSRGRFIVATTGAPASAASAAARLVIPAWPEPARAIEDCRR